MKLLTNPQNIHLIKEKMREFEQEGVFRTIPIEVIFSDSIPPMKVKSYKSLNERFVEYDVCDWTIYCGFVVPDEYEPLFVILQETRSVFNSIDGPKFLTKSPKRLIDRCW